MMRVSFAVPAPRTSAQSVELAPLCSGAGVAEGATTADRMAGAASSAGATTWGESEQAAAAPRSANVASADATSRPLRDSRKRYDMDISSEKVQRRTPRERRCGGVAPN